MLVLKIERHFGVRAGILRTECLALSVSIFDSECLCSVRNIHLDANHLKHDFGGESVKGLGPNHVPGLETNEPFSGRESFL